MHTLLAEQFLPLPPARVFAFFERAENLEAITPPFLRFRILTPLPIRVRAGALIDYRLTIRGVPVRWRTRIRDYDPPNRFVDEQLRGPYRLWVHEHRFEPVPGGTRMTDRVEYDLPRMPGRGLVHRWLVRPDLDRIFAYRRGAIERLVSVPPAPVG
jgi:ligand-binding SRPBCC domain-containing protein